MSAPPPVQFDQLLGDSILVRRTSPDDVEALYEAAIESRAQLHSFMPWCHAEYSRDDTIEWLAGRGDVWDTGQSYTFAVVDNGDGRFLGTCGINQVDQLHQRANLGYWVRTSATGRGVATEATRLVARFGFETLGLERIEIVVDVENIASGRVAEKAGALREGIARRRLVTHGESHDAVVYSLIAEA
jgi:RimJ/RimL family protein N-acetyltransferase